MDISIPGILAISIKRYLSPPEDEKFIKDYRSLREVTPFTITRLINAYFDRERLLSSPLIAEDRLLYEYLSKIDGINGKSFPELNVIKEYYKNFFVQDDSIFFNTLIYESQINKLKKEIEALKKENEDLQQINDSLNIRDYKMIRQIGAGGFGKVFQVEHLLSGEIFAIKRLHSEDKKEHENILREIKALAPLNHPNIVGYKNSFLYKKHLYLVMEYCKAGSMQDRLHKYGKFNEEELIKTFQVLTRAFNDLHQKNIIHHDIKPSNFLYNSSGEIKISDFGAVNTSIGTPSYYPPELFVSKEYISDPRTDVFSLGITLMECALGHHPLMALNNNDRLLKLKNADLPLNQLPYWLQQVILKAINFNVAERFQNMKEFHEAILKKDIPIILSYRLIEKEKNARTLRTHIKFKRWRKAGNLIESLPDIPEKENNLNLLIESGNYFLQVHDQNKARIAFERAQKINPSASIEKQLAEVYIQNGDYSRAASILHGYINRNFLDLEAHNQLLNSYFLSQRWELGLEQSEIMLEIAPDEEVFKANHILFEILCGKSNFDNEFSQLPVFAEYNLSVLKNNIPQSCSFSHKPYIHNKLLFQEYRFRNIEKSKNTLEIEIGNETVRSEKAIISFGRKEFDYNDFSIFEGTSVSRRHFVIINMKNNVWLYDLHSASGVFKDNDMINKKSFLLGLSEINFGAHSINIKSDAGLLL